MAGTPSKWGSRIALVIVVIPLLLIAYFASPLFLPRWRWENLDPKWEQLAQQAKLPVAKLKQTYQVVVRYKARGDQDPCPWQLIASDPLFDPENDDDHHLTRVTLISDRTGDPPSSLRLGSLNYRDIYFKGRAWRFPPGVITRSGDRTLNRLRPVVVYDGSSLEKVELSEAYRWEGEMKDANHWTNDDEDIEDGYKPPGAAAE